MNFYEHWLTKASAASGVELCAVDSLKAKNLRAEIEARYASRGMSPLWERFLDDVGKQREDATELCCFFNRDNPKVLFFDKTETDRMFILSTGESLQKLLEECPLLEFYTTDEAGTFVLCRNHHNYVIGVGACSSWVSDLEGS